MLKIYGTPVSVHTRKVIVAAIAKGLKHEVVPVVPVIPGNPPPNWRELSPTGLIPALSDGDFAVSDSTAINAYLDRAHPEPPLYPKEARAFARALLLVRRNDAERAVQEEAARLRQIETRIAQVDADGALSVDDVVVRAEPARTLLSLRRTVGSFAEARGLIGELHALVKGRPPGALMAVAHAQSFELDEIDVEFGFVLDGSASRVGAESLQLRELPAEESVAACVRIGLPEHAHLVTGKIGRFVEANGYELAGPSRELFLQPPQPDHVEEAVVEMQFPLRRV